MSGPGPLGVLGGTFDPVHAGHLALAREARQQLELECVILMPAGAPWQRQAEASAQDRLAMVHLAAATEPGLAVDDREIRRAGPTYTIDTVRELRAEWGDERPLWVILGADAFLHLHTWHRWQELLAQTHLAVFCRPGAPLEAERIPPPLRPAYEARRCTPAAEKGAAGSIAFCRMPMLDVSATGIREAIRSGRSAADLLPRPVLDYIETHQLYR